MFRIISVLFLTGLPHLTEAQCSKFSRATEEVTSTGNVYTCKDGKTWTNRVRRLLTDAQIEVLDKLDTESGKQKEEIETDCSGGQTNPDIFNEDITVWCAKGCAPLPQDFDTYWDPQYNPQSPTAGLDLAPIQPVKNYTVVVRCRDGYAPVNGNGQTNEAYCSDQGWVPALSNIATCTSGCKDIRNNVQYGSSANLRSTTLGGAPFNIGDVLTFTCDRGYELSGSQYVTCSSTQRWTPETLPECRKTDQVAVSGAGGLRRSGKWWVLLVAVQLAGFDFAERS